MAINRTIDFLPEYFRTIPNQRFLNSTLDRLVSDPNLRQFDGFVGKKQIGGSTLSGNYINEPSEFRSRYQLEPEFVSRQNGVAVGSAGFKDVLNSVAVKQGVISAWNRLVTDDAYTFTGFIDLDKLTNYYNYVWIPDAREINNNRVDENTWYRTPVTVSNSNIPLTNRFIVNRTNNGLEVEGYPGLNPELFLARGGTYTFEILPDQVDQALRKPKNISQSNSAIPVVAGPVNSSDANRIYSTNYGKFVNGSGLSVTPVEDFNFAFDSFTVESWVWVNSSNLGQEQVIVGQWDFVDTINSSWALIRTGTENLLKFCWIDAVSGQLNQLLLPNPITTGAWHHVAVSRSRSSVKIYVDGFLANSSSISIIARSSKPLTIGTDSQNDVSFVGYLDDLRITSKLTRYSNLTYEIPQDIQSNDANTVFLLNFDVELDSTQFVDNIEAQNSRMWIQTHPGTTGNIPSNPALTTRSVQGVDQNGTTTGVITFKVPNVADESYYRNLQTTGQDFLDFIDLATELNFDQINSAVYDTFIQTPAAGEDSTLTGRWGGIDGVKQLDGKTVIFVANQDQGWQFVEPFESTPLEIDSFEETTPVPVSQRFGIWQINVVNGIIKLKFVAGVNEEFKLTIKNGVTYRDSSWFKTSDVTEFSRMPALIGNFTTLYLQDDLKIQNVLPLTINNQEIPVLNVDQQIVGKPYFASGNQIELIDGLHIQFSSDSEPAIYREPRLFFRTQLVQAINNSVTQIVLSSTEQLLPNHILKIDNESLLVIAVNYDQETVTVSRGYNNTIARSHSAESIVKVFKTPSFIVEGVGNEISLVLYDSLFTAEEYLDIAQDPDYITINRASRDQNPWSRSNRWFNRAVISRTLEYLTQQGVEFQEPAAIYQATRPIVEFRAGLRLFNFGIQSLAQVDVFDTNINDALSNVNGRSVVDIENLTFMGHTVADGDLIVFANDSSEQVRDKVFEINFVTVDDSAESEEKIVYLKEIAAASNQNSIVVKYGSNRGSNWIFNIATKMWESSSQQKNKIQQEPKFDLFDYSGNSFSDTMTYPDSNFSGSTLFEYQKNELASRDPILQFGVTYRNIANVGDIVFDNTYGTDQFDYQIDPDIGQSKTVLVNQGVAQIVNPVTGQVQQFIPWQLVRTNLELYQVLTVPAQRVIDVTGQLLNKTTSKKPKVYVDGQQIASHDFTQQQLGNTIRTTLSDSVVMKDDSTVVLYLLAQAPIAQAYYQTPETFEINPFNQRPQNFTLSDLKLHTDAVHSHHGHAVTPESTINSLADTDHAGSPGLILLHESFSLLPTVLLTDTKYDIDRAIKTAADQYELFKLKFIKAIDQIENIENMTAKQAVDSVMQYLTSNKNQIQSWFASDMVPYGGIKLSYVVDDVDQQFYDISVQVDPIASNRAVLVYVNDQQWINGIDYQLFTARPAVQILKQLRIDDRIDIYEIDNTDGSFVPATPAKLGLAQKFVPRIYLDNTYQIPTTVIEGHDGSIKKTFNDYRDQLLLELEMRIFNNIKVDNQLWHDVIESRVPTSGKFRQANSQNLYSAEEQAFIQRRFFYEWVAENRVEFRNSVYDFNNTFTYNYSGSLDKMQGQPLLGYWRGCFKDFYDTDRPHTAPWEMLGYSIEPSWWKSAYGPAPYTGENGILWQDILSGYRRGEQTYSPLGSRTTDIQKKNSADTFSVLDVIPVDAAGQLLSPNDCLVADLSTKTAKTGFTFNDHGPVETVWRRSSTFAFAQLRTKILMNPQFMLGVLWDLDNYKPTETQQASSGKYSAFKFKQTEIPTFNDVLLHQIDTESGVPVRRHGVLNYVLEYLKVKGVDPTEFRQALNSYEVNLVYNLAGFADKNSITVYAEQNSTQTVNQTVKIPQEDYELLLSESVPVSQATYSGVIVTKTPNGYRVTGYDQEYPYFIINPSKTTGSSTSFQVGSLTFVVYQEFENQPIYVPYNFEFSSRQTVVDFLNCYGEYLRRQGFIFDSDVENERINWFDASVQFVKWSLYRWDTSSANAISLVLNPSSGTLKFVPNGSTLENMLNDRVLIVDENQNKIDQKYIDVFRDDQITYINNQNASAVISALRANLINFEHKIVMKNQTVFNDLIYNPVLGTRQQRIRIAGIKTGDWNGTLRSAGFMILKSQVDDWQPNTDYLRGSFVKYKNQNYVALENVIGASAFQQNKFTVSDVNFQDQLMPSIGAKALDLDHAYDLHYQNNIPDMVRLRSNSLGYVERPWLTSLGLSLLNQTEFYRGWLKEKGTLNSIEKFSSAGQTELLADFQLLEEFAVKLGDYGATGRTGFVEVLLKNNQLSDEPVAIEFINNDQSSNQIIQVPNSLLYKKSTNWDQNFIQNVGNLQYDEIVFQTAGPVLPQEIYENARQNTFDYSAELESALTFSSMVSMTQTADPVSLIKNVRKGNWIWIAIDDLRSEQNKYNVISWRNSSAQVVGLAKNLSTNGIDIFLNRNLNLIVGDVVAVDHQDPAALIQGVFKIIDYQVVPNSLYNSVLSIEVKNIDQYVFETIQYADSDVYESIFTYFSLRHSDIGSAELYQATGKNNLPLITKAFVDQDATGYAVYDFRAPYQTGLTKLTGSTPDITYSVAQDVQSKTLWSGKPTADSGNGKVIFQGFMNADLSNNEPVGLTYVSGEYTTAFRSDTLKLGSQVVNLTDGFAAAIATDADNRGQLYILQRSGDLDVVQQIFSADGFSSSNTSVYYGQSISATPDGKWIAVGAPNPVGAGKVLLYQRVENASVHEFYTEAGVNGTTVTLPYQEENARSLRIFADSTLLIPQLEFTVSGNVLTFATSLSNSNVSVSSLTTYYDLVQTVDDPDGSDVGSMFGSTVSLNSDSTVLAVGAPQRLQGKVYVFVKNKQKIFASNTSNTFSLGSNVASIGRIELTLNGQQLNSSEYTVTAGSDQLVLDNSISAGQILGADLLEFNLVQTLSGTDPAGSFGTQVAVNDQFIAISAPKTTVRVGNQTKHQMGKVELWALNSAVNQSNIIDTDTLTAGTNISLRINDWLVNTGSDLEDTKTNINQFTNFTGISAELTDQTLTLTVDQNLHTTGIFAVSTGTNTMQSANSQWQLVSSMTNTDSLSKMLGKKLKWINNSQLLAIVDDYVSYIDNDRIQFDINTQFDSNSTLLYASTASQSFTALDGQTTFALTSISYEPGRGQLSVYVGSQLQSTDSYQEVNSQTVTFDSPVTAGAQVLIVNNQLGPVQGERLRLYQLLRTKNSQINAEQDTVQLALVHVVNYEKANGVELFFDGNLERLWIGNQLAVNEADNVLVQTNEQLLQGWTRNRSQQPNIDTHAIRRAWIYNSRTKEKVLDLDVVDVANGLLPGALAQYIDFITSVDPAVYGIPLWLSGYTYNTGDRVLYSGRVYVANVSHAALFFNESQWTADLVQSAVSNTGSTAWAQKQVGRTWFNTSRLRAVDYQQGDLLYRIQNFNQWFPDDQISIYEWSVSNVPPAQYTGTGTVQPDSAFVFDSVTNQYYFWVLNPSVPGVLHAVSAAELSANLKNVADSGLPLISPATNNSVILYNNKDLIDAAENVLHIEYVTADHNNRLHNEFILLSPDGTNRWLQTPIYHKMVDSLSGVDASGLEVPDININLEDRYGVLNKPRQSMFRDKTKALKIYFEQLNSELKKITIDNKILLDKLKLKQPKPTQGFIDTVADRDTLLLLDVTDYVSGDQILVESDYAALNSGWSLVKLQNTQWQTVTSEFFNLNVFWTYADWQSPDYVDVPADHVIAHAGYLPSVSLNIGDFIEILNHGDNNRAVYQVLSDLTLDLKYLQNGTIQFKPNLYDFRASGIGFDASGFDGVGGFDNDPALALRLIIKALNENILTGSLKSVAENAFFAILRYVLQENINIDWLFKTSFVSVKHRVKNLNVKTNYRRDNEQFVLDFVEETKPYHTRVREYINTYSAQDTALLNTTDFDLPALYDEQWLRSQYSGTTGKRLIGPVRWFVDNAGAVEENGIVYVSSNGLASHPMGLWPGDTSRRAQENNWVFAITRYPKETTANYPAQADNIVGVAINGVPFYSVNAQQQDTLVWSQDQSVKEIYTVNIGQSANYVGPDAGNGYLTSLDWYVYRKDPTLLYTKTPAQHSPIIGFALDGYPIYGPYGYRNSDGTGGIIINTSSYILSSTLRLNRPLGDPNLGVVNGTQFADYAPPTGEYIEDFEYIPGVGTLDQHNGRFVVTPEYPFGTYAYFVTVDPQNLTPVYPYVIGPTFKGEPTGLKFEYRGEQIVPIYDNGNYQMPDPQPNVNSLWPLRTPTGQFPNDLIRLAQFPYADWNQNYTYDLVDIEISDPGYGYTLNPDVEIDAGGSATATINPEDGSLISVNLSAPVTGLTQMPTITVNDFGLTFTEWDPAYISYVEGEIVRLNNSLYYQAGANIEGIRYNDLSIDDRSTYWDTFWTLLPIKPAVLTPVLVNKTTRKIHSTIKFDRIASTITQFDSAVSYAPGETVQHNQSFFTANAQLTGAILGIEPGSEGSESTWQLLSDEQVAQTQAANRITHLYQPTGSMLSNDLSQLLYGAEFPGVVVDGVSFAEYYKVPSGKLSDQADQLINNVSLLLEFDQQKIYQNSFNYAQKINGERSGSVASAAFNNTVQFGSQENNISFDADSVGESRYFTANIAAVAPETNDFTLEFYFRMKELNRQQILLDTRNGVNGGLIVYVNSDNQVCVTDDSDTYDLCMGDVGTDRWHHVAVQRDLQGVQLYFDGNKIDQGYEDFDYSTYNFNSDSLTLGASYDVNTATVANALIDEIRLTVGITRYSASTYTVDQGGFARNGETDPYFGFVYLLYGFESTTNEITAKPVIFEVTGARAVIQDSSVNNRTVNILNTGDQLLSQLPLDEPAVWNSAVGYQVGNQVKSADGNYYVALASSSNIAVTDTDYWRPIVPTEPLFSVPSAVFNTSNLVLDAGTSLDYNLGTDDFTVEFWINPDLPGGTKTVFKLANDANLSLHSLSATVTTVGSNVSVATQVISGAQTVVQLTSGNYPAGALYVSIERWRQSLYLFVNGILVDQINNATWSFGYPDTPVDLKLGNSTNSYAGKLADFRLTQQAARHLPVSTVDSEITSDFLDQYLGVKAEDIKIDGTGFVTDINSPSTEEHVNGRLYETLNIRVFSKSTVETESGTLVLSATPIAFRIFKDMLDNVGFYAIPAVSTTQLTANLSMFDTHISVESTEGFTDPEPGRRGVVFVGAERITYLTVDRLNNQLTGLMRGTLGTSVASVYTVGTRVEGAGESESLPGETRSIGAVRTVKASTLNSNLVQLDKISGIITGMPVKGEGIVDDPTVVDVNSVNKTVTLSSSQTLSVHTLLSFGNINPVTVRPFNQINTNSIESYANTWYEPYVATDPVDSTASNGLGLQRSNTVIANFLTSTVNQAQLPES
jgi:hypothetical protein